MKEGVKIEVGRIEGRLAGVEVNLGGKGVGLMVGMTEGFGVFVGGLTVGDRGVEVGGSAVGGIGVGDGFGVGVAKIKSAVREFWASVALQAVWVKR